MKIGDKVFCINDYYNYDNKIFSIGYEYEINYIVNNAVFISCGDGDSFVKLYKNSERFSEFFLTHIEYRKMKLKKLRDENR